MTLRLTAEQARNAGIVPKRKRAKGKVKAEDARRELFKSACRAHGIPEPVCEHPFAAPERHWRWDYCWPDHGKIALEVDGGVWTGGRHLQGGGFTEDQIKSNAGLLRGWKPFRCTPRDVESGAIFAVLKAALGLEDLEP